jgi:hypothetical protein
MRGARCGLICAGWLSVIVVHDKQKFTERLVVGLIAAAISVDVLATELPRIMPYLVILAVIYIIVRIVFYHTNNW